MSGSLRRHLASVSCYAEAISVLIAGSTTVRGLSEESGLAYNACRKFVATLYRRRLVRIAAWEQDSIGRWTIAAYAWGEGKDVKRPPGLTPTQRSQRMRDRAKAMQRAIAIGNRPATRAQQE